MTKETPTAAPPTPEQRAYAIVQPLTVDSVMRRDELATRIAAAIRQHSEALRAEIERLTKERDEAHQRGYDARQAEIVRALEEVGGRIVLEHGPANAGMVTLVNERAETAEARATTAEAALAAMTAERDALRRTLIDVINRGTDGGCTPEVSTEFLCFAADEAAGVKRQRDASQERERVMREALTVACTWGIASANFSASVSLDLRDWFVAFVAGRREPFPADMLKTLSIIDPDLHATLQPQETADVR